MGPGATSSNYSSETEESGWGGGNNLTVDDGHAHRLDHSSHSGHSANVSPNHTLSHAGAAEAQENISNSIWYDELDQGGGVSGMDPEAKKKALEMVQSKIGKTKELIKEEQNSRDENVEEYLKLSANADRQQLSRIKQVFEKKNQKSAQSIAQFQRKLEVYQRKARDIENNGATGPKQPKEVLKAVGQGIKNVGGGVVGFASSKPKEFAHLIRNKFGSADNINNPVKDEAEERRSQHGGSATLPREGSTGGSVLSGGERQSSFEGADPRQCVSEDGRESERDNSGSSVSVTSDSGGHAGGHGHGGGHAHGGGQGHGRTNQDIARTQDHMAMHNLAMLSPRHIGNLGGAAGMGLESLMSEIHDRREETDRLSEQLDVQRQHFKQELEFLGEQLREERFRCERLEEQMNDLTELHQNEMENIKTGVQDMEEKVQYQSEERLRDIQEQLSSLETKISRMEHQAAQHQQYVTLEGIENSNARALVVKGINVLLTLLQVVLLILATAAQIIKPFLKSPARILTTTVLIVAVVMVSKQWSDLKELSLAAASRFGNQQKSADSGVSKQNPAAGDGDLPKTKPS